MQWISVKDRLPQENSDVLVYYKLSQDEADEEGFEGDYLFCTHIKNGMWQGFSGRRLPYYHDWREEHITHWMPLPKGPKDVSCDYNKEMFPEGCKSNNMLVMQCSGGCLNKLD